MLAKQEEGGSLFEVGEFALQAQALLSKHDARVRALLSEEEAQAARAAALHAEHVGHAKERVRLMGGGGAFSRTKSFRRGKAKSKGKSKSKKALFRLDGTGSTSPSDPASVTESATERANAALLALSRSELEEFSSIRLLKAPPLKSIARALCVALGLRPAKGGTAAAAAAAHGASPRGGMRRKSDPLKQLDFWTPARGALGNEGFVASLADFDAEERMSQTQIAELLNLVDRKKGAWWAESWWREATRSMIGYKAAHALCLWLRALCLDLRALSTLGPELSTSVSLASESVASVGSATSSSQALNMASAAGNLGKAVRRAETKAAQAAAAREAAVALHATELAAKDKELKLLQWRLQKQEKDAAAQLRAAQAEAEAELKTRRSHAAKAVKQLSKAEQAEAKAKAVAKALRAEEEQRQAEVAANYSRTRQRKKEENEERQRLQV